MCNGLSFAQLLKAHTGTGMFAVGLNRIGGTILPSINFGIYVTVPLQCNNM